MAAEGLPIATYCRVMGVSESGFHMWHERPTSARTLRHAWPTEQIRQIHADSGGTYGGRRVHAELTLGPGITVGHGAVACASYNGRNDVITPKGSLAPTEREVSAILTILADEQGASRAGFGSAPYRLPRSVILG